MSGHFGFQFNKTICRWSLIVGILLLGGCASYGQKMNTTLGAARSGSLDVALANIESSNSGKDKDLLYYLEKGELLRMKGDYALSRDTWLQADAKIRSWEESVKIDPGKFLGKVGSFLLNDTTRRYEGRDYEKVFVSVRLALDYLALGNIDAARIEIKKMHEREAIIAEFRAKELESAKEEAQKKGLKATSFKDLQGYPVETLDDPEVNALKNSYESAFANYLAGFVYEALGEPSLASAGYRKAIEMRPNNSTLENGLGGLDDRVSNVRRGKSGVDTLFVVETGDAPAIASQGFPISLPIPSKNGVNFVWISLSWPVLQAVEPVLPSSVYVNDQAQPLALVTNVDQMARRALADEMPGIILRSSMRAIAKGAVQKQMQDNSSSLGMLGILLSAASSVTAVVTEQADERTWRTLPAFYSIGRSVLAPGAHTVAIDTPSGRVVKNINVSGSHAVVVLRLMGNSLYLAQPPAQ